MRVKLIRAKPTRELGEPEVTQVQDTNPTQPCCVEDRHCSHIVCILCSS